MSSGMTPEEIAFEEAAKASLTLNQNLNLGTFILASGTDALLCGVMVTQMMEYWTYSAHDRKFNKGCVLITTTSSLGATIFIIVLMFKLFVYDFGKYTPFAAIPDLTYMCISDIVPSTATQLFFTHRAYKLMGRSKTLGLIIIAMILVSVAGAIGFPITQEMYHKNKSEAILNSKIALTYCWLSGALGADVLITASIMWGLWKSKTGWKETDKTVKRLIRVMVETQLPPTILLIVFFIFVFGYSDYYLDIYPLYTPSKPPVVHVLTETNVQSDGQQGIPHKGQAKPRYLNENDHFSPRRQPAKDPLELDDDSIELDVIPTLDEEHRAVELEDRDSSHKMDYMDNSSRTGLTDKRK
uniref:DUF6534 domain-containing protein n=1 Tax=Kwoniella bestiolae CBS 10118 TaxID=1296100 RepID=A0A1B9FWK1_9TREE|nr:hypothetical protein I302_07482 [Kwoniella bestiolae CBS 10118]OCF23130.1 hypothetical protein I302_07482 [Kwoniella bestiolae CBS 10118]